jgi:hypothetical protein
MHPGDSVVGHPGDLGELRAGVDRFTFWRILQKVKICPSPLVLLRLRRDDMFSLQGEFSSDEWSEVSPRELVVSIFSIALSEF